MKPKLILHGGAGSRKGTQIGKAFIKNIYLQAEAYLKAHSALETVIYAVSLLEDCEYFNAGTGSKLQQDGKARMSASVMDGRLQKFAAVINIENVKNPVQVARLLLEEKDHVLCGNFATHYARKKGFDFYDPVTLRQQKIWRKKFNVSVYGTVGAVALDANGNLAVATSTRGRGHELPGRVSDSAMPCGNYANADAAVSCTGIGEQIIHESLASKIVIRVTDGASLKQAFQKSFKTVRDKKYEIGAIGISKKGDIVCDTTTTHLSAAYRSSKQKLLIQ